MSIEALVAWSEQRGRLVAEAEERRHSNDPVYAVHCPFCSVGTGRSCRTSGGWGTGPHRARLTLANAVSERQC